MLHSADTTIYADEILGMVSDRVHKTLDSKSKMHRIELKRLGKMAEDIPLSTNVIVLEQSPQVVGVTTLLLDAATSAEDFIFHFDRLVALLVERCVSTDIFAHIGANLAAEPRLAWHSSPPLYRHQWAKPTLV